MSNTTVPTHEMIKNLAEYIVNGMSYAELTQHVYDDVYSIMLEDNDMFYANLEQLGLSQKILQMLSLEWNELLALIFLAILTINAIDTMIDRRK